MPQIAEQDFQPGRGLPHFVAVQEGVVGFGGVTVGLGLLPGQAYQALQERPEGIPVVFGAGFLPGGLALGRGLGQSHRQVRGNAGGPFIMAPPFPYIDGLGALRVSRQGTACHPVQVLPHPGVGLPFVQQAGQETQLCGAVGVALGGNAGALVPGQELLHRIQSGRLPAMRRQPLVGFFRVHVVVLE